MSKYPAYRGRLATTGSSSQDAMRNSTKRQAYDILMSSPTLSYVILNKDVVALPSIVSDIETFYKRRFLFTPNSRVNVGDYIRHKNDTYLAIDAMDDEIYPQLIAELCNDVFRLVIEGERIIVDRDWQGKPIYEYLDDKITEYPCVMRTTVYSALSNASISLPTGAMILKIPFSADDNIPLNYTHVLRDAEYRVTDVKYEWVLNDVGYVEIHLQREVNKNNAT